MKNGQAATLAVNTFCVKLIIYNPAKNHDINAIINIIACFSVKAFDMIGPPFVCLLIHLL